MDDAIAVALATEYVPPTEDAHEAFYDHLEDEDRDAWRDSARVALTALLTGAAEEVPQHG